MTTNDLTPIRNEQVDVDQMDVPAVEPGPLRQAFSVASEQTAVVARHCYDASGEPRGARIIVVPAPDGDIPSRYPPAVSPDLTEERNDDEAIRRSEARYRAVFESSAVGIGQVDCHSGRLLLVNPKYCEILGYSREELLGMDFSELTHPDDRAHNFALHQRLLSGEIADYTLEKRYRRKSGNPIWVRLTATLLRDSQGRPAHVLGVIEDITEQKRAEQALEASEARWRALVETTNDWLWELDEEGRYTYASPQVEAILGYTPAEVLGKTPFDFMPATAHDRVREEFSALLGQRASFQGLEKVNRRRDGSLVVLETSGVAFFDKAGGFCGYRGIDRDITRRKQAEEELVFRAYHDTLTKLPNRRLLRDRVEQTLLFAERHANRFGVLFLDLDNFKLVNDSLGHELGDELLKTVADRLRNCVREIDTVARYGGDEFVILLTEISDAGQVNAIVQRILAALAEPVALDGYQLRTSASVGISLFPEDGQNVTVLLRNADAAMYRAKEAGRNTFQFYTAELNARLTERLLLGRELLRALEREELEIHFQPQVDLQSGEIAGVEALVRWYHPELGAIAPGQFIPLAEELGLIGPLGEWVLRQACLTAKSWQAAGLPGIPVSVNVSPRQFERSDVVALVRDALNVCGLGPEYLELELTESAMLERPQETAVQLEALRELKVRLALDDFGTGYSSLAHLHRYPFDTVKIDKTFIKDITCDPAAAGIVRTVLAMARGLGLRAVAEGVETAAQLALMRRSGCHAMQGYYFSRPVSAKEMEQMLRERRCLFAPTPSADEPKLPVAHGEGVWRHSEALAAQSPTHTE